MAGKSVKTDELAMAIMEGLEEYAKLSTDDMKAAVKKAGSDVRKEIELKAPRKTGEYAKSWTVRKTMETSDGIAVVVHSRNRYQLAHLLEHGHANRNGGRTKAPPHIAPAEEKAEKKLEENIRKALGG